MALFRKRKAEHQDGAVLAEEPAPQSGVQQKDLVVITQLTEHGADLSQPRAVTFWLYAPDTEVAKAMASDAESQGFEAEIREPLPEDPELWAVVCSARAVVDPIFVSGVVEFFEGLAERHGAEYDGWEAEV